MLDPDGWTELNLDSWKEAVECRERCSRYMGAQGTKQPDQSLAIICYRYRLFCEGDGRRLGTELLPDVRHKCPALAEFPGT